MTTQEINNALSLVAEVCTERIFNNLEDKESLIELEIERIPDKDVRDHVRILIGF